MNKKGFISIYGIMLLSICMGFTSMLYVKAKSIRVENENLAYAELYAIHQIKLSMRSYEEDTEEIFEEEESFDEFEDEEEIVVEAKELYYDSFKILITPEIESYTIQIYDGGQLKIYSQLRYDSSNHKIISYDYL
ncbi:hypothetical protein [Breznakia pachnodae]|uniref:Uncharacterized protein n=1 Tax=Breznakia pachnodae TaxID=265178 RepID=A0ABU0E7T1_9FIRM|nr:hypothetical protein [Breznakia pachnodae]MDQ0362953.1 hypothetical protein [Breznakia pachnodae]